MAWFRNHYVCIACDGHWIAEGTEVIEADCPHCHAYDVVAYRHDDLSVVTAEAGTEKALVAALKATAEKMRGMADKAGVKVRPVIRAKGRGAARVAVH
jgi:hypothetical protein